MKASLWALILSLLLGGTSNAQQPFFPVSTNILPEWLTSPSQREQLRAKAEKGNAAAQFILGMQYQYGDGVSQDYVQAAKWYRMAADQGLEWPQYFLSGFYAMGFGVPQDYAESVKWCRKAADQGFDMAQHDLGFYYLNGKGVTQDYVEAVKWYRKAADQGLAIAQFDLGHCYFDGKGVLRDYQEAVKWYRKAADQGLAAAQNNLGFCYADGDGVLRDYVQAYKWGNLASSQNSQEAKYWLPTLEQRMSPEEIAEAQRLARQFSPSKPAESAPSLTGITTADDIPKSSGTGFFITEDGFLVTAAHVVNGANRIRILTRKGPLAAHLIRLDTANDIALLKADGQFSALPIASSRAVKLGNTVATIGFPNIALQGFAPKFGKGEIASLSGVQDDPRYFQISVPVQPGNSGGPLVDERGNVIGVVTAKLDAATALAASGALPENVNYATKSSFVLSFLESMPEAAAKVKTPVVKEQTFEEVIKSVEDATVLVMVY